VKPRSKPDGLDPKYKSRVVVLQEKCTKTPKGQSAKEPDRRNVVVQEKPAEAWGAQPAKLKMCQVGNSDYLEADGDAELCGVPGKTNVSKERKWLEKRKALIKLRKQKSKSWVIS